MKRLAASCVAMSLGVAPAAATGGFSCSANDKALTFEASSALGRGMGSPILNLQASAVIRLKGAPVDLSKLDLSQSLVHSWMAYPHLWLHFYTERADDKPHGTAELIIKTKATGDEISSDGSYELTVYFMDEAGGSEGKSLTAKGKVHCEVE